MFLFCKDDDEVQLGDVRQDEGKEERASFQPYEEGGARLGEGDSRHCGYLRP